MTADNYAELGGHSFERKAEGSEAMTDCVTAYGFTWGPCTVQRLVRDKKYGYLIGVATPTRELQVWVSPTGKKITATETVRRKK